MRWNAITSRFGTRSMTSRLAVAKATQPPKSRACGSARREGVPDIAHRLDELSGHLVADPADRDVDHVAAGVAAVAPDARRAARPGCTPHPPGASGARAARTRGATAGRPCRRRPAPVARGPARPRRRVASAADLQIRGLAAGRAPAAMSSAAANGLQRKSTAPICRQRTRDATSPTADSTRTRWSGSRSQHPAQDLEPVDPRQHQVEQDQVVLVVLGPADALGPARGAGDDMAVALQDALQERAEPGVVLDRQYPCHLFALPHPCPDDAAAACHLPSPPSI